MITIALAVALAIIGAGCDQRAAAPSGSTSTGTAFAASGPAVAPRVELVPLTNMVLIKAGALAGLKRPLIVREDFWIGRFEVTQGEFAAVMGRNPSHFAGENHRPVEKVTYFDAWAYCQKITERERSAGRLPAGLEYRLPTEVEWEFACRAGSTNQFSFGDDPAVGGGYAWTAENSAASPRPVGQKRPNAWGLHDMHGNVWEWVSDWFNGPSGPGGAPAPTNKFKIFKGGGWNQDLEFARSANRFMMAPSNGIHFVGFRVVLGPVRPEP